MIVQKGTRIVLCLMYYDVLLLEDDMHSKFVQYSSGVLGDSELGVCIDDRNSICMEQPQTFLSYRVGQNSYSKN